MSAKARVTTRRRNAWLSPLEWWLAALLTAVAIVFHVVFSNHAGALWRDEANSAALAGLSSFSRTLEFLRYDSFPPLFTLLLRGWVHLGWGSDPGLRIFGFLVGILVLGALWLTCRLLGCRVALISIALAGLDPWVVRTVQSIRPYGLGTALIVATLGCAWRAVETGRTKWFLIAGVLAVASVQCMYQNAFLLLAICIAGVIVCWRDSRPKAAIGIVLIGTAAVLSLAPYAPSIVAARSWGALVRGSTSTQDLVDAFVLALGSGSAAAVWLWSGLALLSALVGAHAFLARPPSRTPRQRAFFCAVVLVVAAGVYWTAVQATQLLPQPWYYVPLAVMVAPALEGAIQLLATTHPRRVVRVVVAAAVAIAMGSEWRQLEVRWTNIDAVATHLAKHATAGDTIVLYPFWIGVSFQRYYKGPAALVTIPPLEDARIVRYDLVQAAMARPGVVDPVLESMRRTLQSGHRVWWVAGLQARIGEKPPPVLPPAPLPRTGWYLGPYLFNWGRHAAYLLQSHGMTGDPVDIHPSGPVSGYEDVAVTAVSGWR